MPVDLPLFEATTAVIDDAIHDTYDPSRNGTRCVHGYFTTETGVANVE